MQIESSLGDEDASVGEYSRMLLECIPPQPGTSGQTLDTETVGKRQQKRPKPKGTYFPSVLKQYLRFYFVFRPSKKWSLFAAGEQKEAPSTGRGKLRGSSQRKIESERRRSI
jgi:hypothetical protein